MKKIWLEDIADTDQQGGVGIQPGDHWRPFWAHLWWMLKWQAAANCAKEGLELNLSRGGKSKCKWPGVRSLPCLRNKKVTVLLEVVWGNLWMWRAITPVILLPYTAKGIFQLTLGSSKGKLTWWAYSNHMSALKLGSFLWLVAKEKIRDSREHSKGLRVLLLALMKDERATRKGMWQSLKNRE